MIRRPPRSTQSRSSAASDVYKRQLPERWAVPIDAVDVGHEPLDTRVTVVLERRPVELGIVIPLAVLGDLASHEKQFLARMRPHIGVERAQVRELPPRITGHLVEERPFAVDDLVVAQWEYEVLAERIHQCERELIVVKPAMNGVVLEVVERVVHPTHVPFETESEAPHIDRTADSRPRGRFLGDHHHAGVLTMHDGVELLEKVDRVEVLAAPELVRYPVALLAGVVEIQHGSNRIDAQSVDVKLLDPVQRVRDEEVADLGASVVED